MEMHCVIKVAVVEDGAWTLDALATEIAKKLYEMSRDGHFKISSRALTDCVGIDERYNKYRS